MWGESRELMMSVEEVMMDQDLARKGAGSK